jgi:hypothetical protein
VGARKSHDFRRVMRWAPEVLACSVMRIRTSVGWAPGSLTTSATGRVRGRPVAELVRVPTGDALGA